MRFIQNLFSFLRDHPLLVFLIILSVGFSFTPIPVLIEIGTAISPTRSLQDKTILLFRLLKITLPLFMSICLGWMAFPQQPKKRIQSHLNGILCSSRALPIVLSMSFVVRLAWIATFPTRPYADSEWYFRNASELASGYGFVYDLESRKPLAAWPIGYPAFLALLFMITGPSVVAAKLANVVLSVLCVALSYFLALRIFNHRLAVVSAFLLAMFPGMIVYSSLISTDLLFMTLTTLCFTMSLGGLHLGQTRRFRDALLTGIVNGALCLVRATGLSLLPIWGGIRWLANREASSIWRWLLGASLGTIVVVFPWTLRNYIHYGKFIPVSTNGGLNFWIGNNPAAYGGYMFPRDETNPLYPLIGNELEIDRKGYELGFQYIRQNPLRALKLLPAKLFYLYNSNDFGLHWDKLSALAPRQSGSGVLAFALVNLIYVITSILALIGIISLLLSRVKNPLQFSGGLLSLYWTIIHLPYFGQDRFVLSLLPVLVMYAALGVVTIMEL